MENEMDGYGESTCGLYRFNRTLKGRYVHLVSALAQRVRSWKPQESGAPHPQDQTLKES